MKVFKKLVFLVFLVLFFSSSSVLAVSIAGYDLGQNRDLLYLILIGTLALLIMLKATRTATISLILAVAALWGVYEVLVAFSFLDYKRETYSDENNN